MAVKKTLKAVPKRVIIIIAKKVNTIIPNVIASILKWFRVIIIFLLIIHILICN